MTDSRHPWVHKHAPKHSKDIVGQEQAIVRIKQYLEHYKPGQKPILLVGGTGIGKTSIAYALAHELDLELLEVNASDTRNKESMKSIIGQASVQMSLFARKKAILIDEADGISGTKDRGGIPALIDIIKDSRHPIIITANEDDDKIKSLAKVCEVLHLERPSHEHVTARLAHIAKSEGVKIEKEELSAIARRTGGDMRAAINDMQSAMTGDVITKENVAALGERQMQEAMQSALLRIFKTTSAEVALPSFEHVDEDVDGLLLWIDENLPREYQTPEDLARGFDALAEADKYFGRIRRWQYYRYYVYIYDLLTAGIALAKDTKRPGVTEYKPTGRILKMWIYNQKNFKRKKIAQLLAPHLHTSAERVTQDILPYIKVACRHDKKLRKTICTQYGIDDETAEWFEK